MSAMMDWLLRLDRLRFGDAGVEFGFERPAAAWIWVVAAVIAHLRPGTRVSYVMTDGAALPLALSDLVADLWDHQPVQQLPLLPVDAPV